MSRSSSRPDHPALDAAALLARLVALPRPDWFVRSRSHRALQRAAEASLRAPVVAARWRNAVLARLAAAGPARARLDLSRELSVCVATVGGSTFPRVLAALERQDCAFRGPVVVRNVSPSGRALQLMNERCETPYYVQLGEDMVLKPDGVRTLHERLLAAPPEAAGVCLPLWDTHLRRTVLGVKILRRDVLAQHGYREVAGTGFDLDARLRAAGHPLVVVQPTDYLGRVVDDDPHRPEVVGEHVLEGTTLLYERYRAVFAYSREHQGQGDAWRDLLELLRRLGLDRRRDDPDLWALLGAVAGLAGTQRLDRSYRAYRSLPGLRELRAVVAGGPEELALQVGSGDLRAALTSACRELRSLRAVRLLRAERTTAAELARLIDAARGRGLAAVVELTASAAAARALAGVGPGASVELVVEELDAEAQPALEAVSARGLTGRARARVHVRRADLLHPARQGRLERLLAAATAACAEVELAHALPGPTGADEAFWAQAITDADDAAEALAALCALKDQFEGLHLPAPLRRTPGVDRGWARCDSPFRGLCLDARGDASGCVAGRIAPSPEHGNLFALPSEALWHGRHLTTLRGGLTGSAPMRPECVGCHWNHA